MHTIGILETTNTRLANPKEDTNYAAMGKVAKRMIVFSIISI